MLPVALQSALLAVAVVIWSDPDLRRYSIWSDPDRRRHSLSVLACGITLAAYGILCTIGWIRYSRLCHQFPYSSLENRLPRKAVVQPQEPLPEQTAKSLGSQEEALAWTALIKAAVAKDRAWALERLHEHAVDAFADQAGFGNMRMPAVSEKLLKRGLRAGEPLPQPGMRISPASLEAALDAPLSQNQIEQLKKDLAESQKDNVMDFVHPDGFGYVKDLCHVAGFQAHQFSKTPALPRWRLQTIDLVGLVLHEEPVVYLSNHLPRMDELREAPTRPADDFESTGLKALRHGDSLYVRAGANGGRALGSVRSIKQCVACHGGQWGDLLGAFSYTFTREKP